MVELHFLLGDVFVTVRHTGYEFTDYAGTIIRPCTIFRNSSDGLTTYSRCRNG